MNTQAAHTTTSTASSLRLVLEIGLVNLADPSLIGSKRRASPFVTGR
jgi:hypothetical protein